VTLGAGAPLLPRAITTPPLVLESALAMPPGFVQLKYRVARGHPEPKARDLAEA
jgi:hypothetical protein